MQGVGKSTAFAQQQREIMDRARWLVQQSWQQSHAVAATAAAAWDRLAASEALLSRTSPTVARVAWVPAGEAGAPREGSDVDGEFGGAGRSFKAVEDLIEQVELAAIRDTDAVDGLIRQIKALIRSDTDHYGLMGILLEGIVQSIGRSIPAPGRKAAVAALLCMLMGRIRALGDGVP